MNTFIETLSLMKRVPPVREFRLAAPDMLPAGSTARCFSGQQTNEPQTKYYIWKLAQSREVLDRIIVIVTEKCMNDPVPDHDGLTTYGFYKAAILRFLESFAAENTFFRDFLLEHHGGSAAAYLNAILMPVTIPERMESAEWRGIVDLIIDSQDAEHFNLYFDFTGGSRLASLISLLLLRIIEEAKDATVRQIVYSDLQELNDPKLVDCTSNYSILTSLERIAVASAGDEKVAKITEELIRMGLEDEAAREGAKQVDSVRNQAKSGIRKVDKNEAGKAAEAIARKASSSKGLASGVRNKAALEAKIQSKESVFAALGRRGDEQLIKDFHEEIMGLLLDEEVLCFTERRSNKKPKDRLKELMKANSDYVEGCWTWKENGRMSGARESVSYPVGVYPQLRRFLEALDKNAGLTPIEALRQLCDVTREDYRNAIAHRFLWYFPKGFTSKNTASFMNYLIEQEIDEMKYSYVDLVEIQSVYYNLGFPFVCSTNSEIRKDISDYYLRKAKAFAARLEDLQGRDQAAYRKRLKELLSDPNSLEVEVPIMVRMQQWSANVNRIPEQQEREDFVKTLCERIEKVRPYRNAVAHNLKNQFRDTAAQKRIAEEIRSWLKEYETRFCQT